MKMQRRIYYIKLILDFILKFNIRNIITKSFRKKFIKLLFIYGKGDDIKRKVLLFDRRQRMYCEVHS